VKHEGKRTLSLDIGNDGERLLIPAITVELFDQQGASIGRFDAGRTRIYPSCSVRAKVDLTDVPPGHGIHWRGLEACWFLAPCASGQVSPLSGCLSQICLRIRLTALEP
jgi:hypothetical protein